MNRRKVCSLSVAFLLGVAAKEFCSIPFGVLGLVLGIVWIYSIKKEYSGKWKKGLPWMALFGICFGLGMGNSLRQSNFRASYGPLLEDGMECCLQGKIYQKEQKKEQYLFYLKDCVIQLHQKNDSCNQILVYLDTDAYSIGEIICVKGKIKTFSLPRNQGNYNERQYYQSLKIDFAVKNGEVFGVYGKPDIFRENLSAFREKLKKSYQSCMKEADAGVLTAMTLGDKSLMDAERKSMYQDAGISHFYSISGLHISMLGMALYQFLRKRGGSYFISGVIGGAMILVYGELIGYGISASRAIGMFLIALYAKYRGRSYDRPTALALMAVVLVSGNTGLLHHAGFLLSFGAVLGVILAESLIEKNVAENTTDERKKKYGGQKDEKDEEDGKDGGVAHKIGTCFKQWCKNVVKSTKETFFVSLCIQIVTIPILCQFFYEISVYSVFVNLVILPCMGALLGLGILGGVAGCFSVNMGKYMLIPCGMILQLFELVCKGSLNMPYASLITGEWSMGKMLFWYGLTAGFFLLKKHWKKCHLIVLLLPLCFLLAIQKTPAFEMDFLDVGQGDGIYIATGDGTNFFVDGGSSDVSKVGTYRILPFLKAKGVRQMDYWFVSHCDSDHISGLLEIMEDGYKIKNLVVSEKLPEDEAWQELQSLALEKGISILEMKQGDVLSGKGDHGEEIWSVKCLFPERSYHTEDRNALSMALLFQKEDFYGLFAGDISEEEEKMLLKRKDLPEIDVYKASHHGSSYSNSMEFLEAIQPEITVISCGLQNRYGHPGKKTLQRLEEVSSEVFLTMECGAITVDLEKHVLKQIQYL